MLLISLYDGENVGRLGPPSLLHALRNAASLLILDLLLQTTYALLETSSKATPAPVANIDVSGVRVLIFHIFCIVARYGHWITRIKSAVVLFVIVDLAGFR